MSPFWVEDLSKIRGGNELPTAICDVAFEGSNSPAEACVSSDPLDPPNVQHCMEGSLNWKYWEPAQIGDNIWNDHIVISSTSGDVPLIVKTVDGLA